MKLYIKRKFIENFLLLYDLKFVHKHKHHHKHDAHFHFLYVNNEQSFLVYNYKVHEYIFLIIVRYLHNRSFLLIEADQMFSFSSLGWFSNISLVICVKLEINSETSTSALTSVLNF